MVQQEYKNLGMDMRRYQQKYLLSVGGRMILMTILMVAASVLLGFLSSRTAGADRAGSAGESLYQSNTFFREGD